MTIAANPADSSEDVPCLAGADDTEDRIWCKRIHVKSIHDRYLRRTRRTAPAPQIRHGHCYCPLGEGKVNIPAILDMMDGRQIAGMIMVELDGTPRMPMTALEAATIAKAYLEKQGVVFRNS